MHVLKKVDKSDEQHACSCAPAIESEESAMYNH
jgi:hypothetical protein